EGGGEASSTAIRALVKKLIAAENPAKPFSDCKLTSFLSEQGIMVAPITVAKYKEPLFLSPLTLYPHPTHPTHIHLHAPSLY
ncbi:RNA polymerase factor sigma-54, partial [Escherichia coli]|uniref:RNA polymerase factor sigma-54 n=1 Tax=Escherichia coli TaxID=562 RepID=UPI00406A6C1B